jgi:FolB domain-containing protein
MKENKIRLRNLRVKCKIGCTDGERATPQLLIINVTCTMDLSVVKDLNHVHAADMLNYDHVREVARTHAEKNEFYTLEALGYAIVHDLLMLAARPKKVKVRIAKPTVFDDCVPDVVIRATLADLQERRKNREENSVG